MFLKYFCEMVYKTAVEKRSIHLGILMGGSKNSRRGTRKGASSNVYKHDKEFLARRSKAIKQRGVANFPQNADWIEEDVWEKPAHSHFSGWKD
jgi:hypothetical protein